MRTVVFRTKILHAYGFDLVRILYSRGEISKRKATFWEMSPEDVSVKNGRVKVI